MEKAPKAHRTCFVRTCIVCRKKKHASLMQRIVALPESLVSSGTLRLVFYKKGQRRGRGAWVCLDPNCLELLPKNLQKIKRAFKRDVDISALLSPTSEYASLSTQKGA